MLILRRAPHNVSRFYCASKMATAGEARDPCAYRDSSKGRGGMIGTFVPPRPHSPESGSCSPTLPT